MIKLIVIFLVACAAQVMSFSQTAYGFCPTVPTLKPNDAATIDKLDGFYKTMAYFDSGLAPVCHRMRFTPNGQMSAVQTRSRPKTGMILGIPLSLDYDIRATPKPGVFTTHDKLTGISLGDMYVLNEIKDDAPIVLYFCQNVGLLRSEDIVVLKKDGTYLKDDQDAVAAVLKENSLPTDKIKQIENGDTNCEGVMTA